MLVVRFLRTTNAFRCATFVDFRERSIREGGKTRDTVSRWLGKTVAAKHDAKVIWEPWEGCQAAAGYKTRALRCRASCGNGSGGGISDGLGRLATRVSKFIKSDHDSCLIWQLGDSTAIRCTLSPHRLSSTVLLSPCNPAPPVNSYLE